MGPYPKEIEKVIFNLVVVHDYYKVSFFQCKSSILFIFLHWPFFFCSSFHSGDLIHTHTHTQTHQLSRRAVRPPPRPMPNYNCRNPLCSTEPSLFREHVGAGSVIELRSSQKEIVLPPTGPKLLPGSTKPSALIDIIAVNMPDYFHKGLCNKLMSKFFLV